MKSGTLEKVAYKIVIKMIDQFQPAPEEAQPMRDIYFTINS